MSRVALTDATADSTAPPMVVVVASRQTELGTLTPGEGYTRALQERPVGNISK